MADTPLLEARQITRRAKDGSSLLHGVSLELRAGDRWAITGPTGSGKTLFLRALCLLDEIEAGEILWQGNPIENTEVPLFRRQVIYLHQRPVLFEGTVEENLRLPFSPAITEHAEGHRQFERKHILELLAVLGYGESFLQKSAHDLSGGEAQITALLRAIQLQPKILMLDEPTAALDAQSSEAIETLVDRWRNEADQKRVLVWVSHDPGQVERIAEKVFRLQHGQPQE